MANVIPFNPPKTIEIKRTFTVLAIKPTPNVRDDLTYLECTLCSRTIDIDRPIAIAWVVDDATEQQYSARVCNSCYKLCIKD
jgi:hypothetical protein